MPSPVTLESYIRASYPFIVAETFDPVMTERRVQEIAQKVRESPSAGGAEVAVDVQDILSLKGQVAKYFEDFSRKPRWTICLLRNIQFVLQDKGVLQALHTCIRSCRMSAEPRIIVGMCPTLDSLPAELEREGVIVRDGLPGEAEIAQFVPETVCRYWKQTTVDEATVQEVCTIGKGMTLAELERAIKLSVVTEKTVDPRVIAEVKKQIIRQSAALSLYQPTSSDKLASLAGMENMKHFVRRTQGRGRGLLALGPPGTGKTAFAKALASELGVPLLILDVGSLFHGLVGSSEANMRRMIATVEAFGRCFLLVDEIEKAFSGLTGGGSNDGGTTQRTLSKFLTWLSDRRSLDAYVLATCNALRLPPEYVRAGRFSSIFYIDLPKKHVREEAWRIHKGAFGIPEADPHPVDEGWTGAEIFQCCETASNMRVSLKEAATYVTHVTRVAKNDLDDLRRFARETGLVPADEEDEDTGPSNEVIV